MAKVTIICVLVNFLVVSSLAGVTLKGPQKISTILKNTELNDILSYIDSFIANPETSIISFAKEMCSGQQNTDSDSLNFSLSEWLNKFIASQKEVVSSMMINETVNMNFMIDENVKISEFKLKNLNINGLENIVVQNFVFNICEMTSEIKLNIPKIEIKGTYTLNGEMNQSSVSGEGNINVDVDNINVYDRLVQPCNLVTLLSDECKMSNENRTMDYTIEKLTVNMSGIKYMDLTETQINDKINEIINNHYESNKVKILNKINDIIVGFQKRIQSRVSFKREMKKILKNGQSQPIPWVPIVMNALKVSF